MKPGAAAISLSAEATAPMFNLRAVASRSASFVRKPVSLWILTASRMSGAVAGSILAFSPAKRVTRGTMASARLLHASDGDGTLRLPYPEAQLAAATHDAAPGCAAHLFDTNHLRRLDPAVPCEELPLPRRI